MRVDAFDDGRSGAIEHSGGSLVVVSRRHANRCHQFADAFFALVEPGSLVRTEGAYDGASILASKMFLRVCTSNCL